MTKKELIKENNKLKELLKKQQGALVLDSTTITKKNILINGHIVQFADLSFKDCKIHIASKLLIDCFKSDKNIIIKGGEINWPPHLWKVPNFNKVRIKKAETFKGKFIKTDIEHIHN